MSKKPRSSYRKALEDIVSSSSTCPCLKSKKKKKKIDNQKQKNNGNNNYNSILCWFRTQMTGITADKTTTFLYALCTYYKQT